MIYLWKQMLASFHNYYLTYYMLQSLICQLLFQALIVELQIFREIYM